ncbi:11-beta-hydroxysteroid dehydrogenase-like 4A [Rutidosis leptorrhynchoides]|uniref:11-beta-hydroxysteroid dehydrogenase-like 4A n=1 Tax=Rutidosis leptorrhynchoides TaxID=125765 RepID=UPI003A99CDE0
MLEPFFRNKYTNELVLYIFMLILLLFSPFLFLWELIVSVRACCQPKEDLSGKVVLITGASSGLGELMAYEYARRGARLAIIARQKPHSPLKNVADKARELGSPDVLFIFADVSKVEDCRMIVDNTIKHFGHLDHLVCNAGIGPVYLLDADVTTYKEVMEINFWGSVYITHLAIPHLMKTRGKIIVNSSSAGICNPPRGGVYVGSKAALISFYESLRFDISPTITVTIMTLGFIQTSLVNGNKSDTSVGVQTKKNVGAYLPTMEAEPCIKAIMDGICKGAKTITEPRVYKGLFFIKYMFPKLDRLYLETCATKLFVIEKKT